jgi:hypothetical protein
MARRTAHSVAVAKLYRLAERAVIAERFDPAGIEAKRSMSHYSEQIRSRPCQVDGMKTGISWRGYAEPSNHGRNSASHLMLPTAQVDFPFDILVDPIDKSPLRRAADALSCSRSLFDVTIPYPISTASDGKFLCPSQT